MNEMSGVEVARGNPEETARAGVWIDLPSSWYPQLICSSQSVISASVCYLEIGWLEDWFISIWFIRRVFNLYYG